MNTPPPQVKPNHAVEALRRIDAACARYELRLHPWPVGEPEPGELKAELLAAALDADERDLLLQDLVALEEDHRPEWYYAVNADNFACGRSILGPPSTPMWPH